MKNITISLPDDLYRRTRIRAAERETSVSGLVRQLLAGLGEETEFQKLRSRQEEILDAIHRRQRESGEFFSAADRLSREEVHDRHALRRLERSPVRNR